MLAHDSRRVTQEEKHQQALESKGKRPPVLPPQRTTAARALQLGPKSTASSSESGLHCDLASPRATMALEGEKL